MKDDFQPVLLRLQYSRKLLKEKDEVKRCVYFLKYKGHLCLLKKFHANKGPLDCDKYVENVFLLIQQETSLKTIKNIV